MSLSSITVRHNFETAHRLPFLPGKCESLHGHSWWVDLTIAGIKSTEGIVIDFGRAKHVLRGWIDEHLDHGTMLGVDDPLTRDPVIRKLMGKVFVFGGKDAYADYDNLLWPTVENVAEMLYRMAVDQLKEHVQNATVVRVKVHETHVNFAEYVPR